MKLLLKIIGVFLLIATIAGFIFWQKYKKAIFKNTVDTTLQKKTDSLYYVKYDSTELDEINGNFHFYNVALQSDSLQKAILKNTDDLPNSLFRITVAKVSALGVDMTGLLQNQYLTVKKIVLYKPVIQVFKTGNDKPTPFTYQDSLKLYQKITGNFKSIQADSINIVNGTFFITDKNGKALTTLENINISLTDFKADSTRNYKNVISYFIKDVKASIENVQLPASEYGNRINITKLVYDAPAKILKLHELHQYQAGNSTPVVAIHDIVLHDLDTDAFITKQALNAGKLSCNGGLLTIFKKSTKNKNGKTVVELSGGIIDEIQIDVLQLKLSTLLVSDLTLPNQSPLKISALQLNASAIAKITGGKRLINKLAEADWTLQADELMYTTKKGLYKINAKAITVNNKQGNVVVKEVLLKPLLSEAAFVKQSKLQADRYDFHFKNIEIKGVDFKQWITENEVHINTISLQPHLKIFNSRILPRDSSSNLKKYPHQQLLSIPFSFYIKKIVVNNGTVYYKEQAKQTGMSGTPYFSQINAVIDNTTNIEAKIKVNAIVRFTANTLFMGTAPLKTEWLLPLSNRDTVFTVTGTLGNFDATILNQITRPLAKLTVQAGQINKLTFKLTANDYRTTGKVNFLYKNLKVALLKMSDDSLKKNGLVTVFANTLIHNNNPEHNNTYTGIIEFKRNMNASIFNLLWKSVLDGVKKTVLRK